MNVKEAYAIIKEKHDNERVVECLKFEDFYAFFFVDKNVSDGEAFAGAYHTVQKMDGVQSTFNPTSDFEAYFGAKHIDVKELF